MRKIVVFLFLSVPVFFSCGRSSKTAARNIPPLIRLSDLADDRGTKFGSLRYTTQNFELLQG
ncbi:MAG TPA: hypothetical protein VI958_07900, partial [Acidobacteriota bacterium]